MDAITDLSLSIKTSSARYAGTDAAVYLTFCTPDGPHTYRLPTEREELEAGKLDIIRVGLEDGPDIEAVQTVLVVNGMNGPSPAWQILWVGLNVRVASGLTYKLVDSFLERWLDTRPGTAPLAVLPLRRPFPRLSGPDSLAAASHKLARIP